MHPTFWWNFSRDNLDPFRMIDDVKIWDVLEKCHVKDEVEMAGGLDIHVKESGVSFSVGQRQLLCLARALLKSSKVSELTLTVYIYKKKPKLDQISGYRDQPRQDWTSLSTWSHGKMEASILTWCFLLRNNWFFGYLARSSPKYKKCIFSPVWCPYRLSKPCPILLRILSSK